MNVFRWIVGGVAILLAIGTTGCFALYMAFDGQVWLDRTRTIRRWLWLDTLLWFNVEVWGQVALTIYHWRR